MAEKFGKTWWGEHWLRSLKNVDYDNRLPRGGTYARMGRVNELKIKENKIIASVTGNSSVPYSVQITIPEYSMKEKERLMSKIIERPAVISKLLNRELDPAILGIAEETGLTVFPRQWTDFEMSCSCPDWAVPCKHLAAVIYVMCREIDNNPFLVFETHNINILEELKKFEIFIPDQKKMEIPQLENFLIAKKTATNAHENAIYERVDFSELQDISNALVNLLSPTPPFYPLGDFREKYAAHLSRISKDASRILSNKLDLRSIFFNRDKFSLTHRSTLMLTIDGSNNIEIDGDNHRFSRLEDLISALFELNPDRLTDFQPSVAAFYKILLATIHLIANGMIIPQIVQLDDKKYAIRWLPATIDRCVKKIIEKMSSIMPDGLLQTKKIVRKKEQFLTVENQSFELLSIFISKFVTRLTKPSGNDLFEDLFFNKKAYAFDRVGENALSGGIKTWLDRYYLAAENYKPVLTVSESPKQDFKLQIMVENTAQSDSTPVNLENILKQKQYEKQRYKILQSISLLNPFIHGIDAHINMGGEKPIMFSNDEFASFMMDVLPAIKLLDIKVMMPKSLQSLLRPKISMKLKKNPNVKGYLNLHDLLSFEWQVAMGDTIISQEEFNKLLKNASRLFKFKENYIYVTDADIEKIQKAFATEKTVSHYHLLQAAFAEEYEGAPIVLTEELRNVIKKMSTTEEIPLPAELNAKLRPYQHRGFSWMYRNCQIGFGSIIADDMGLGKTLQVICILLKLKEEKTLDEKHKALVIAPTGLLTNWQTEIEKFAPTLSTYVFHGQSRDLKQFKADVMLTTYGVLRSDHATLKKEKWQVMIIDEAQNIKNEETAQSKAVKSIPAKIKIAMSGTPVENRLTEFWSIMDYTNKGYLGAIKTFKDDYANPIQLTNDEKIAEKFRKVTAPFMLRRMKTDKTIISDLPDKIEQNQFAQLTKQQAALYQKTMQAAMKEIEGCDGKDPQTLFKRQGLVLQMILALKQICNHPTQFLKNSKYEAALSGKTELLFELLDSIIETGEKVLIFTQFTEMGELLERFIYERFGENPMFYYGGCSIKKREEMVHRFQHNRADKIFVLSLKAAGAGLNLTAASHVIHYDLWWNPAVENQATDRAFRIGQTKNVIVHRLICKNTFEEKIDEMIQKKKNIAQMTIATGESWIGKMSNKELREIFGAP